MGKGKQETCPDKALDDALNTVIAALRGTEAARLLTDVVGGGVLRLRALLEWEREERQSLRERLQGPCAHQSPGLCVSWDYPMITVDGTEYQIAGWCCACGALRVFAADNLDEERWLLPRMGVPRG